MKYLPQEFKHTTNQSIISHDMFLNIYNTSTVPFVLVYSNSFNLFNSVNIY